MSAINTTIHKLGKFLVSVLKSLTSNEYTVKDSFTFAEEIVEQDSEFFMGRLEVDSLFNNTRPQETIDICTNTVKVEGLSTIEFKELFLATKEFYFIFTEKL